jgi:hypothetical protein
MPAWLIDFLPRRFGTRRGFTRLLAFIGFLGSAGYSLFVDRFGLVSALFDGVLSALLIFLAFWYLSRNLSGFVQEPEKSNRR